MHSQNYISIQYLRAIAALMVVCFHLHTTGIFPISIWTSWLAGGVDIFFVISGFIMVRSTDGRGMSAKEFFIRRLVRIVPMYWLLTCFAVTLNGVSFEHIAASFLFIPALHPAFGIYLPVLEPGWTLNLEMFFYLIFGLTFALPPIRQLALIAILFSILVFAGTIFSLPGSIDFYANPLLLEFVAGMALARFSRQLVQWTCLTGVALLTALHPFDLPRVIEFGIPAVIIFSSFLAAESWLPRIGVLKIVGDSSYAIYLAHFFTLGSALGFWRLFFEVNYGFMVFAVFVTIVVGIMLHIGIERPVTRNLTAWSRKFAVKGNQPLADAAKLA
jgi:exopolysaccharide production protein ExoZ